MTPQRNKTRKERFTQFLNYLKSGKGFSLSKVAENIGISVQGLYKINRGESNPSKQTVMLLEIKYGLNPTWYHIGTEKMIINPSAEHIEQADGIMLELLQLKNQAIAKLDQEHTTLKKESALLKKALRPRRAKQTEAPKRKVAKRTGIQKRS